MELGNTVFPSTYKIEALIEQVIELQRQVRELLESRCGQARPAPSCECLCHQPRKHCGCCVRHNQVL